MPLVLAAAIIFLRRPRTIAAQADNEVTPEVQQLYAQAKAAQQQNDIATAIEKYRAMIKLAPHLAAAYNNLGMLYFNEHDYARTAEVLQRGLELNPDMPTASAMLGMSYFQLGEEREGRASSCARHCDANPNDDQVEMTLCRILINARKLDEATTHLNRLSGTKSKESGSMVSARQDLSSTF